MCTDLTNIIAVAKNIIIIPHILFCSIVFTSNWILIIITKKSSFEIPCITQ